MKKKFKDTKVAKFLTKLNKSKGGTILKSIIRGGVVDVAALPIGGAAGLVVGLTEGLKNVKNDNLSSEAGGSGKVDWVRVSATIIVVVLSGLYLAGYINKEQVEFVINLLYGDVG